MKIKNNYIYNESKGLNVIIEKKTDVVHYQIDNDESQNKELSRNLFNTKEYDKLTNELSEASYDAIKSRINNHDQEVRFGSRKYNFS